MWAQLLDGPVLTKATELTPERRAEKSWEAEGEPGLRRGPQTWRAVSKPWFPLCSPNPKGIRAPRAAQVLMRLRDPFRPRSQTVHSTIINSQEAAKNWVPKAATRCRNKIKMGLGIPGAEKAGWEGWLVLSERLVRGKDFLFYQIPHMFILGSCPSR